MVVLHDDEKQTTNSTVQATAAVKLQHLLREDSKTMRRLRAARRARLFVGVHFSPHSSDTRITGLSRNARSARAKAREVAHQQGATHSAQACFCASVGDSSAGVSSITSSDLGGFMHASASDAISANSSSSANRMAMTATWRRRPRVSISAANRPLGVLPTVPAELRAVESSKARQLGIF